MNNFYKKTPGVIKEISRVLRKNMTLSEQKLWNILRRDFLDVRFLRQKPIYVYTEDSWLDRFIIADFYCNEKKLIIEVDGKIHLKKEIYILDREKENYLQKQGIHVIRILNEDISKNLDQVIREIKNNII